MTVFSCRAVYPKIRIPEIRIRKIRRIIWISFLKKKHFFSQKKISVSIVYGYAYAEFFGNRIQIREIPYFLVHCCRVLDQAVALCFTWNFSEFHSQDFRLQHSPMKLNSRHPYCTSVFIKLRKIIFSALQHRNRIKK